VTPLTLLLQASPDQNFGLRMMLNFALIIPIFYFLLIRPQVKERKRHEAMVEGVKKGDEIVTNGGLIGKIVHADGHRLTLRTGDNTRVTVDRGRVAAVLDIKGEPKEE
jgi:preprotein translocase subunit YajC